MMTILPAQIPLSLYIHFPWCIKKCPYCDFNSHTLKGVLPEEEYIDALLLNLNHYFTILKTRPIKTIFMGGGTPSLFSPRALRRLLNELYAHCQFVKDLEITLEANPGTVEQKRFKAYRDLGINRLSLGIQSFNDGHLHSLGRIHDGAQGIQAVTAIKKAGFTNFNLDLMFGLPHQNIAQGLKDLECALALKPPHLSWYELTLEPNTFFWYNRPTLPPQDKIADLYDQGQALLAAHGYQQYEISAYSQQQPCNHNLNYWEFGDYLAIGAGSHGKITDQEGLVTRVDHFRHPKQYMDLQQGFIQNQHIVAKTQLPFEFLLNTLRLSKGVPVHFFAQRTGLALEDIGKTLQYAQQKGWLEPITDRICTTTLGYRFLNEVISLFLPMPS